MSGGPSQLDLKTVFDSLQNAVTSATDTIKTKLGAVSGTDADDPAKLAELQQAMNTWVMVHNIQSSVIKKIADLNQSIAQKM